MTFIPDDPAPSSGASSFIPDDQASAAGEEPTSTLGYVANLARRAGVSIADMAKQVGSAAVTPPAEGMFDLRGAPRRLLDVGKGLVGGLTAGIYQPEIEDNDVARARATLGNIGGVVVPFSGISKALQAARVPGAVARVASGASIGAAAPLSRGDFDEAMVQALAGSALVAGPEAIGAGVRRVKSRRATAREYRELKDEVTRLGDKELQAERIAEELSPTASEFVGPPEPSNASARAEATAAARDMLTSHEVPVDPSLPLFEQTAKLLNEKKLTIPEFDGFLRERGLTWKTFATELYGVPGETINKNVNSLFKTQRQLDEFFNKDPQARRQFELIDLGQPGTYSERTVWNKLNHARRGLMVTQLATTARNVAAQAGRFTVAALDDLVEAGLQRALKVSGERKGPLEGVETIFKLAQRNKPVVDKILAEQAQTYRDQLLSTYMSDLQPGGNPIVNSLNFLNQWQERFFRRAAFNTKLDSLVRSSRGRSLAQLEAEGKLGTISETSIAAAVEHAQDLTFALSPRSQRTRALIDLIDHTPATLAVPYPRFAYNALKFLYEHSPLALTKFVGAPGLKNKINVRSTEGAAALAKSITGSALTLAAYQFIKSDAAGEHWYEAKIPGSDKTIDLRAYGPFSNYLFPVALYKHWRDGTLDRIRLDDLIEGISGLKSRTGPEMKALTEGFEWLLDVASDLDGEKNWKQFARRVSEFGSELIGQFSTPLRTLTDLFEGFEAWQRGATVPQRLSNTTSIVGRIPGVARLTGQPLAFEPTSAAPVTRENPILRQLAGVTIQRPKNAAQRELDRLGFSYQEIFTPLGDQVLDNLRRKHLGKVIEGEISELVSDSDWKELTDAERGEALRRALGAARKISLQAALAEAVKQRGEKWLERFVTSYALGKLPRRQQRLLEAILHRDESSEASEGVVQ